MGIFNRVYPFLKSVEKKQAAKGKKLDLREIVEATIGNNTGVSDYDCRISLK